MSNIPDKDVYDKFIDGEGDFFGFVAYGLYIRDEHDLIAKGLTASKDGSVISSELSILRGSLNKNKLNSYKNTAEQIAKEFTDEVLKAEKKDLAEEWEKLEQERKNLKTNLKTEYDDKFIERVDKIKSSSWYFGLGVDFTMGIVTGILSTYVPILVYWWVLISKSVNPVDAITHQAEQSVKHEEAGK